MTSYLVFPSPAAAQARSNQQAVAMGCTPPTLYWWAQVAHPTNGEAALIIEDSGDFGPGGLTPAEIAALQTAEELTPLGWVLGS